MIRLLPSAEVKELITSFPNSAECDGPPLLLPPDDILATVATLMREYFGAFDSWDSIPVNELMRNLHKSLYVEVQDAFTAYTALPPAVCLFPLAGFGLVLRFNYHLAFLAAKALNLDPRSACSSRPRARRISRARLLRPGPGAVRGRLDIGGGGGANKSNGKGAGVKSSQKRKTAAADAGEHAVIPTKRSKGRKSIVKTEATINDKYG
ncbi:hypothetical protein DL770_008294 [Monosporascus sp. CRB-9-2]|nr:hypothetical protein DL770_008294 [Monosporascus sp. CRB-9-2]